MNYLKMVMHTSAIARAKKLKNKKKELDKKSFLISIIENGEIFHEADAPKNIKPVIRFKSKIEGTSSIERFSSG